MHHWKLNLFGLFICFVLVVSLPMHAIAGDWPTWRGPNQDGTSTETGLISTWSVEGENLLWLKQNLSDVLHRLCSTVEFTSWDVLAKTSPNRNASPASTLKPANVCGIISLTSFIPPSPSTESAGRASLATQRREISMPTVSKGSSSASTKMAMSFGRVHSQKSMDEYPVTVARVHTPIIAGDLVVISYLNSGWGDASRDTPSLLCFR